MVSEASVVARKMGPLTFSLVQPHFTAPKFVHMPPPINERTFPKWPLELVPLDEIAAMKLEVQGRSLSGGRGRKDSAGLSKGKTVQESKKTVRKEDRLGSLSKVKSEYRQVQSALSIDLPQIERLIPDGEIHPEVERVLELQVERLSQSREGQRNQDLYKAACVLGRYHGGGMITITDLSQALLRGAHRCGLLTKVGEPECLRQIYNGVRWGAKRPIKQDYVTSALSLKDHRYNDRLSSRLERAIQRAQEKPQSVLFRSHLWRWKNLCPHLLNGERCCCGNGTYCTVPQPFNGG